MQSVHLILWLLIHLSDHLIAFNQVLNLNFIIIYNLNSFFYDLTDAFFVEWTDGEPLLDWPTRKQIALGSAKGLAYLHDSCDPKVIHRDVKAANVLLDQEFGVVVADFGLAKLMDYRDTDVTTAVHGTLGHIAPEYLSTGRSSDKTDVYGYGIMLLEIITGQRAFDLARLASNEDVMLLSWVCIYHFPIFWSMFYIYGFK